MRQIIKVRVLLLLFLFFSFGIYSGCGDDETKPEELPVETSPASRALWIWGSSLSAGEIQTLVNKLSDTNINEVYLLVKGTAGTRTSADILTDFITQAHAKAIKVHLWLMINEDAVYMAANPNGGIYHCPNPSVNTNPYPMNDGRVNLLYPGYKEYVLDEIGYFLTNFDCDGIHLDGIRFGHFLYSFDEYSLQKAAGLGCNTTRLLSFFNTPENYTTYATNSGFVDLYVNGDQDVVKWVEMRKNVISDYIKAIRETIKRIKPGIELTAAFMPEGITDPAYSDVFYAQNYALHSTILDMISPMAYFKSYGKTPGWITDITYKAKKLADPGCRIAVGLQADVTASEMDQQIRNAFNMGSDGVIIFRYGYGIATPLANWNVLKIWFGKDWERISSVK